jgi:hypothetical protein
MDKSKKSELAMIAKKCHSIKDFFMTNISPTSVESGYPTPNHNFKESRSPPPLAQFEATQPSTAGAIRSVAQPSTPAQFEESCSPPPPPAQFKATSSTIGYPTPNHNHVQANKRHAVIDDCSNSNGKVSNTKTKKVKTNCQINSKAKSAPTIEGIADTLRLQSQCSSIAPCDWEDELKYDRENIEIWNAWLTFITNSEIKTRPLVPGAELFLVPRCLPWYIRSQNFVFIVMHFLTTEESHGYKNQIMLMVNISIILPMHFKAMALYEVSATNRYAKVALMNSSDNLAKAKGSHMHLTMAQRIISILFSQRFIILKS